MRETENPQYYSQCYGNYRIFDWGKIQNSFFQDAILEEDGCLKLFSFCIERTPRTLFALSTPFWKNPKDPLCSLNTILREPQRPYLLSQHHFERTLKTLFALSTPFWENLLDLMHSLNKGEQIILFIYWISREIHIFYTPTKYFLLSPVIPP